MFKGSIWIIGGSPLKNDVWRGSNLTRVYPTQREKSYVGSYSSSFRWSMNWDEMSAVPVGHSIPEHFKYSSTAPWMPRAGAGATAQFHRDPEWIQQNKSNPSHEEYRDYDETLAQTERLYLMAGFAGWRKDDSRYDGERARNDVWYTTDGTNWTCATKHAAFSARAWFGLTTWHKVNDTLRDVSAAAINEEERIGVPYNPRMWIAGGGYMGTKGNNVVKEMEAYIDVWWSRDGEHWYPVSYTEGETSKGSLYSASETFYVQSQNSYIGKWGLQLIPYHYVLPGSFPVYVCYKRSDGTCVQGNDKIEDAKIRVPSLYFIGGDTTGDGTLTRETYKNHPHLLCTLAGDTSSRGKVMDGPNEAVQRAAVKPESFFVDEPPNRNIVCNRPFFELQKENQQCGKLYDPLMAESQYILLPDVPGNLSEWIKVETTCCGTAFNHQDFELYRHQSKGEVTYHAMYKGCQCDTEEYVGEFCEKINDKYQAAAPRTAVGSALVVLVVVGLDFFLLWR